MFIDFPGFQYFSFRAVFFHIHCRNHSLVDTCIGVHLKLRVLSRLQQDIAQIGFLQRNGILQFYRIVRSLGKFRSSASFSAIGVRTMGMFARSSQSKASPNRGSTPSTGKVGVVPATNGLLLFSPRFCSVGNAMVTVCGWFRKVTLLIVFHDTRLRSLDSTFT